MSEKRVLIVDDDPVSLDAVGNVLQRHGYRPRACADPAQALSLVHKDSWDLVVLDLGLPSPDPEKVPVFDGFKLLGWFKQLRHQVPVIVFTQSRDKKAEKKAIAAGAAALVHKQDKVDCLLQAVRLCIG